MMTKTLLCLLAVSTFLVGVAAADPGDTSTKLVRAAHLESTQGKIQEAIDLYRQILADPDAHPELATRARLELASSLVKLSEAEQANAAEKKESVPNMRPTPVPPSLPEIKPPDPPAPPIMVDPLRKPERKEAAENPKLDWEAVIQTMSGVTLEAPGRETIETAMLKGMAEALGGRAEYLTPADLDRFRVNMSLNLVGIGAVLEMADEGETLLIRSVLAGSPAEVSNLQTGDKIVAVDGKPLAEIGDEMFDYVDAIRGRKDTVVKLGVIGGDDGERFDIDITRAPLALSETTMVAPAYETDRDMPVYMVDHDAGIGALRLRTFAIGLADKLREKLSEMKEAGLRGLVIDLRENGGGSFAECLGACGLFVGDETVATMKHRNGALDHHRGKGEPIIGDDIPVVLLVNGNTASAAEILAAALQDHNRALVIGSRSFGKGTIETMVAIDNGGAMKVTISEYLRPSGKAMRRPTDDTEAKKSTEWGVHPTKGWDIEPVELPRDLDDRARFEQDPVWRTAMEYLSKKLSKSKPADE